jgi:hypothetical protein
MVQLVQCLPSKHEAMIQPPVVPIKMMRISVDFSFLKGHKKYHKTISTLELKV